MSAQPSTLADIRMDAAKIAKLIHNSAKLRLRKCNKSLFLLPNASNLDFSSQLTIDNYANSDVFPSQILVFCSLIQENM